MGPGRPAIECDDEELVSEFELACRGGDYEFAPEYRTEIVRRLTQKTINKEKIIEDIVTLGKWADIEELTFPISGDNEEEQLDWLEEFTRRLEQRIRNVLDDALSAESPYDTRESTGYKDKHGIDIKFGDAIELDGYFFEVVINAFNGAYAIERGDSLQNLSEVHHLCEVIRDEWNEPCLRCGEAAVDCECEQHPRNCYCEECQHINK